MSDKVRIGVVGTSWWADAMYLPALTQAPARGRARRRRWRPPGAHPRVRRAWGIPAAYDTLDEMLDAEPLDALVDPHARTCTTTPTRWRRIERGLHVLCEKPLAMTSAQARQMAEAAERAGVITMTPFTYRFMPVNRYLKELVDEGYIGRPYHLNLRYYTGLRAVGRVQLALRPRRGGRRCLGRPRVALGVPRALVLRRDRRRHARCSATPCRGHRARTASPFRAGRGLRDDPAGVRERRDRDRSTCRRWRTSRARSGSVHEHGAARQRRHACTRSRTGTRSSGWTAAGPTSRRPTSCRSPTACSAPRGATPSRNTYKDTFREQDTHGPRVRHGDRDGHARLAGLPRRPGRAAGGGRGGARAPARAAG